MYVEVTGAWIDGLVPSSSMAAGAAPTPAVARTPQPIDWPREEDGTIVLLLYDRVGQQITLNIGGGDSATLNIGANFTMGAQRSFAAVADTLNAGRYIFTLTPNDTRDMIGPLVYEVRVVFGGKQQQVVPPAYFTVQPMVASP